MFFASSTIDNSGPFRFPSGLNESRNNTLQGPFLIITTAAAEIALVEKWGFLRPYRPLTQSILPAATSFPGTWNAR